MRSTSNAVTSRAPGSFSAAYAAMRGASSSIARFSHSERARFRYRPRMPPASRMLIVAGVVLVALGLVLWLAPSLGLGWLGRLPGDLRIERPGLRIYVPFMTSILASVALTLLFWLFSRLR